MHCNVVDEHPSVCFHHGPANRFQNSPIYSPKILLSLLTISNPEPLQICSSFSLLSQLQTLTLILLPQTLASLSEMAKKTSRKRKVASQPAENGGAVVASQEDPRTTAPKAKRTKTSATDKPKPKQEYFPEKRNLEDLWQAAFPVGTEWDNMEKLREINWSFTNLEDAFEEGGELNGKTVYLFGSTEAQLLVVNGEQKVIFIPIVVAVVSPIPPSDKIGLKSVQRETEDIIPMKAMKMAWIPYIPLENRQSRVDRLKAKIFTLGCNQRRTALKHLKEERIKQYDYCLPYLQPLKADEIEDETTVDIMYPLEPPIVCEFDWELDELEEFTEELIKGEELPADQKDAFKEYVREKVRERKKEQREAKEARRKALEDMNPETKAAFENMRFYKFYPVQMPDTPDINRVKEAYINRYYGKAHMVL